MKTLEDTLAAHTDLSMSLIADINHLRSQMVAIKDVALAIQTSTTQALSQSAMDSVALTQKASYGTIDTYQYQHPCHPGPDY